MKRVTFSAASAVTLPPKRMGSLIMIPAGRPLIRPSAVIEARPQYFPISNSDPASRIEARTFRGLYGVRLLRGIIEFSVLEGNSGDLVSLTGGTSCTLGGR